MVWRSVRTKGSPWAWGEAFREMGGVLLRSLMSLPGPQSRLLGRAVAQQRLVPGGPWQGGAGGGLHFSTRLRCRPPARGPYCLPHCPRCIRRCLPYSAACRVPPHRRCWPLCCAHQGCGADGRGCALSSANSTVFRSDTAGLRCDPPGPVRPASPRAPEAAEVAVLEPLPEASPSPCALGPCFNGGACAPAPPPGAGYSCRCPPGFHGSNCERRADRCANRLCLHGGHCLDLGHSVICKCQPGFSGARCEHNVDDCSPNPCANGGTCVDGTNSYSCSCTLGYAGDDCRQRADACASGPCLHGATCYTHFSGHVCACPPGYMGPRCEEEVGGGPAAPHRQPPAPLALACALPIALLGPGLGLVLAARGWRRRPAGESGRTLEPMRAPSLSLPGMEQELPRASATQVGLEQEWGCPPGSALSSLCSSLFPSSRSEAMVMNLHLTRVFWGREFCRIGSFLL
ncbi:delta-like protein 3 isoform X2 [Numida meleagris]|uniref:delta-like protein 3 isoform X2 n=1 Tax=Numida meleagris TaxID=8996 RepID=UPI000B3E389B|nr:delta-like protein 3 isoform X2 [Numida meleagris]